MEGPLGVDPSTGKHIPSDLTAEVAPPCCPALRLPGNLKHLFP